MKAKPSYKQFSFPIYLTISFVEGGAVLACELLSARMIAPFYGTTLFVWSTVIGVTLTALAVGYFLGGFFADRYTKNELLFIVLSLGSILIALMPLSAEFALNLTGGMNIRTGALLSGLIFLFPPLACLGMTSPIVIRLANRDLQHTGRTAGTVYAVSTISGILTTFFIGFYVIPNWGITSPAYYTAIILAVFPILFFIKEKRFFLAASLFAVLFLITFFIRTRDESSNSSSWKILYKSEGLLGQVIVSDWIGEVKDSANRNRVLFVNNQPQTNVLIANNFSAWPYAHAVSVISSIKPPGAKSLILGLGGGSVANEFFQLGFQVDACELDDRVAHVAHKYFHLDNRCKVFIDDARHFVRTSKKKYDIIVLDTFSGEQPPSHLLTLENCFEIKRILVNDGILIINFTGFLSGDKGLAARSIYRTLVEAGFFTNIIATPGSEEARNLVFVASPIQQNYSTISADRQNTCCINFMKVPIPPPFMNANKIDLANSMVFTDDKPSLDFVHLEASETWRRNIIKNAEIEFSNPHIF